MKRKLFVVAVWLAMGFCAPGIAQPGSDAAGARKTRLENIQHTYPQLPEALAGYLADDDGDFRPESRCDLVDWFAFGRSGVPDVVTEKARTYQYVCVLPLDGVSPNDAAERLNGKMLSVDVADEVVMLLARAGDKTPYVCCSPQIRLERIGDGPYWGRRLRLRELDRGMLSFILFDPEATDPKAAFDARVTWRGPNAPPPPPEVGFKGMKGTLQSFEIDNAALGERRKLNVYLPPGWTKAKTWPAVFIGDGAASSFMLMVDEMITLGQIRPIVLVGMESGADGVVDPSAEMRARHADLRSAEYLPEWGGADNRFDAHLAFVADEVTAWATREFNVSAKREDRMVSGYSNGGVFALFAAVLRPDVFAYAAPLSPGWREPTPEELKPGLRAKFRISGGLYEPDFHDGAKRAEAALKAAGYDVIVKYPAAGHFHDAWSLMLSEALRAFFPAQ